MVSLSNESRHQGGYFFNDDQPSIQSGETEHLIQDHVVLTAEPDPPFRKIGSSWAIVFQMMLFIGLVVVIFVLPVVCGSGNCRYDAYAIILFCHGGLWFLLMLLDRYFRYLHNISRLQGYLEFYRKTCHIRRWPLTINSCANAVLVIVVTLLNKYCHQGGTCGDSFKREYYLQIVMTLEVVVVLPINCLYLIRTLKFNRREAYPDVSQDEMLHSFNHSHSQTDIGFRDETYTDSVLEKQADMIRYLKQHNTQLGKRVMILTAELNSYRSRVAV